MLQLHVLKALFPRITDSFISRHPSTLQTAKAMKAVSLRPQVSRALTVRVAARVSRGESPAVRFSIHGRHVDVTEPLEQHVRQRLQVALDKFKGAEYMEGEGGLKDVDVKLMNSQVELRLRPRVQIKQTNDTFLRQGELKVLEKGSDVFDSLDKAVVSLEKKLKRVTKAAPMKKDYRRSA